MGQTIGLKKLWVMAGGSEGDVVESGEATTFAPHQSGEAPPSQSPRTGGGGSDRPSTKKRVTTGKK